MLPRVVITDYLQDDLAPERKILGHCAQIDALAATSEAELVGRIENADCIILYHELAITRDTIDRLEHCRLIVRGGVGVDNVDLTYARKCGIPVANVPDYGSEEVADSALAMTLSLMRGVNFLNQRMCRGDCAWSPQVAAPLFRLRGVRFGIVGLGRIGSAVALRAKSFGMDVCFYDPYKPDGYDKALGIRRCDTLDELLTSCRAVSLHCPLTPETQHMLRAETIALMQTGSYLINTARGPVVDTACLPPAIESGQLAGAGIDVLASEPPAAHDPLVRAWRDPAHPAHYRVILCPHAAFYSEEGMLDIRVKTAQACLHAIRGAAVRNVVN